MTSNSGPEEILREVTTELHTFRMSQDANLVAHIRAVHTSFSCLAGRPPPFGGFFYPPGIAGSALVSLALWVLR